MRLDVDIVYMMSQNGDVNNVHIPLREAGEMIDIHLINTTAAALGIGAAVVLLVAAAVIAIAAVRLRRPASHRRHVAVAPKSPAIGHAATPVTREPALR